MLKILLFIFLLLPAYAHSAEWVLIGNTTSGDTFYIDETSVKRNRQLSTVREKQAFKFSQLSRDGSIYKETVLVKTYNCENRTFSIREAIGYDEKGNLVFNEKFEQFYTQNPDRRWNALTPNSIFLKSYDIACR